MEDEVENARRQLLEGIARFGVVGDARRRLLEDTKIKNDADAVRFAQDVWMKPEGEVGIGFRIFVGTILMLYGDDSPFPAVVKLMRENPRAAGNPPGRAFTWLLKFFPYPNELKPPGSYGDIGEWYGQAPLNEWYDENKHRLHWNEENQKYELHEANEEQLHVV